LARSGIVEAQNGSNPGGSGGKPSGPGWRAALQADYERSHRHPFNAVCHLAGIPLITLSLLAAPALLRWPSIWWLLAAAFGAGWLLQFAGHAVEGKPPEFLRDWRFFLVGFSWWWRKVTGSRGGR
jgi:uncharacterized membrane protein YGL010W